MSYSVEHVRCTYTCDVCGFIHKRDGDRGDPVAAGWVTINYNGLEILSGLLCPKCALAVYKVLTVGKQPERDT